MKKAILSAFFLLLFIVPAASGQTVVIDFGPISGAVGETVQVPVTLAGVESTAGFNSFSFTVSTVGANLVYNQAGNSTVGTLGASTGWNVVSNSGKVAGFASSSNAITTSGVLINLSVTIQAEGAGSIELTSFTLKKNNSQGVAEDVPFTPVVPTASLSVSNAPEAVNDSYNVDEGGLLVVTAAEGVLANDTDADGDPLTVTIATNPTSGSVTLAADGSFTYMHNGAEASSDTFSYTVSDGADTDIGVVTISVAPINDAPVFTSFMTDLSVEQGDTVVGDFDATDGENDLLEYSIVSGPAGAQIDANTGDFVWTATTTGTFPVQVAVSDGTVTVNAAVFTITVQAVEGYQGSLSGLHEPAVLGVAGTGSVTASFIPESNLFSIEGSFQGLESLHALSDVSVGAPGAAGETAFALTTSLANGSSSASSGTFDAANNSFDLDTQLPSGITATAFIDALRAGNVFVNVRTTGNLSGELRTQLLPEGNSAPSTVDVSVPVTALIEGDPGAVLFEATWSSVPTDSDGDEAHLYLQVAADAGFGEILHAWDVSVTVSSAVQFTVANAAELADEIIGAPQPGGTANAHFRLVSSDGAALAAGQTSTVTLVRGLVTDTETEGTLPDQFLVRGNYPNPFNPSTSIEFDLPETADVEIRVLDLLGRTMMTVPSQPVDAGRNQRVRVDAEELASGIYIYQVIAVGASRTHMATGTMTLIK